MDRRGYLQRGAYVPEVVLEYPEAVAELSREFVRCGSDVVPAFTYYAHRSKMEVVGKHDLVAELNRKALQIAKDVAAEFPGSLVAGNICNTAVYVEEDPATHAEVRAMYTEQLTWVAEAGVDYVIAETLDFVGEALIALECIKAIGVPAVVTFAMHANGKTRCGKTAAEACKALADAGAAVVGLNCCSGPQTMLLQLEELSKAGIPVPLAALPAGYRTTPEVPTMHGLSKPGPDGQMHCDLDPHTCTRYDFAEFAEKAAALGVRYMGTCCGGAPHHIRAMAMALGRKPSASKYCANMSKHHVFGHEKHVLSRDKAMEAHW